MLKLLVPKQSVFETGMGYVRVFYAVYFRSENWFAMLKHKVLGTRLDEIVLRNGVRFIPINGRAESGDLCMLAEVWHDHVYTPPYFDIGPSDIVFDIGANNGYFALFAATCAPNGKVYAFEPAPQLAEAARKNVEVNGFTNVIVEESAIANATEDRTLFLSKLHDGCHSLYRRDESDEPVHVRSVAFAEYCKEHTIDQIDFLKMDCEGAEYEIMLQLPDEILKKIKKIAIETHDDVNEHRHGELVEYLHKKGFLVAFREPFLYAMNPKFVTEPVSGMPR